ncbi:MAG: ATP-binding protein [Pseudomonadota bacterium]|nr:ATP-binding protein [Pseudomonadota bacterium]
MTKVYASPSKNFFVDMLTRDIELDDAILDLLDNCIDGVVRQLHKLGKPRDGDMPYEGYWAKIHANQEEFSITDNCGGIPRDIAINSAFRLGRPDLELDRDIATVGMYGIGMKRALFKMGKNSFVVSKNEGDAYEVRISQEWLTDDDNWDLTLEEVESPFDYDGTKITVNHLRSNVMRKFDSINNTFLDGLSNRISQIFGVIIKKGFTIFLNGNEIIGANLNMLSPKDYSSSEQIQPYLYSSEIDNVKIELVVGFYRELYSDSESDDIEVTPRAAENAGWTIICNDRVVLYKDKSHVTGWGVGNVPSYHPQFRAISGVVKFFSKDSAKLPLTSTKRGLDQGNDIYGHVLKYMTEGMKLFTDFTNRWKGREVETKDAFESLVLQDATDIPDLISSDHWRPVRGGHDSEKKILPILPKPVREEMSARIIFYRSKEDIKYLGEQLFDDPETKASDVGGECFDIVLKEEREKK